MHWLYLVGLRFCKEIQPYLRMSKSESLFIVLNLELFPITDDSELHAQIPAEISHRQSQRYSQTPIQYVQNLRFSRNRLHCRNSISKWQGKHEQQFSVFITMNNNSNNYYYYCVTAIFIILQKLFFFSNHFIYAKIFKRVYCTVLAHILHGIK